jgi:transposase
LLAELNFELWIGDAAVIRTKRVRKQKTDRQDAQLILQLMMEDRFPQIWVANWEIGICGNCCGTGTAWCRPALES